MDNLKIYQICHDLIDYFATLTSPKKSYLGPIFRTGGSIFDLIYNIILLVHATLIFFRSEDVKLVHKLNKLVFREKK